MRNIEVTFAFKKTIPVLLGYIVLGMAFGILLNEAGYNALWALAISTLIYAGSMQFALLSFIGTPISLVSTAIMTLSINSRHIFYGLSFIDIFRKMKAKGLYMIFSLTDETYPLLCMNDFPEKANKEQCMFFIALFNHLYWIIGSLIGNVLGNIIPFNTTGLDFAMTALFVVIFLEQYLSSKSKLPAYIGISSGIVCLLIFKSDNFLLPALIQTVLILLSCKQYISERGEQ